MPTPPPTQFPGMHTLTPHLVCEGASDAIAFYKKAFNAEELARLPGADGKLMHAMLRIGDSTIMLCDDFPQWGSLGPKALKGSPVYLHLYVKDVDAAMKQAVDAGAQVTMPVADMFWGDRYGQLVDPFGHRWSMATHKLDLTPEEIRQNMERWAAAAAEVATALRPGSSPDTARGNPACRSSRPGCAGCRRRWRRGSRSSAARSSADRRRPGTRA